jgi:hypothetical protein
MIRGRRDNIVLPRLENYDHYPKQITAQPGDAFEDIAFKPRIQIVNFGNRL